jgi:hypothetical protein
MVTENLDHTVVGISLKDLKTFSHNLALRNSRKEFMKASKNFCLGQLLVVFSRLIGSFLSCLIHTTTI